LREVDNEEDEVLSGSESDAPDVVSDNGGASASASGVVDAVKVTESPCTTFTIEEQEEEEEEGIAATTRAYPFSHYALPVHAHPKECYPVLSLSSSSHHDDGTGSSYSSSQFASEEEVEEGKKVPGRPIRVKIPGGAMTTTTAVAAVAVAAAEGVVQKTRDGGDDVKVTESTETTRLRPPLVSSMKGCRKKKLLLMCGCVFVGELSDCRGGGGVGCHCSCCYLEGEIGVGMKRREREEEGEREKEVFLGFFWVFFLFMLLSDEYDRSFLSLPFFLVYVCLLCVLLFVCPPFPLFSSFSFFTVVCV